MTLDHQDYTPLKLGFIGGGINSAIGSAHFAACMLDNRFHVHSGCFSRDAEISQKTAARWNIDPTLCYTNWRDYLEKQKSDIDALCILTPIPDHYDMLTAALDMNVPVICEKALVSNSDQAYALVDRYEASPHFLAVTLNYSGYPIIRLLRKLIADGRLGALQQVHLEMPLENYTRIPCGQELPAKPQLWRQRDATIPTLLLDLGVHLHHLLHYVTGTQASSVMAQFNHFSKMPEIIDDARIWVDCDTGLQASLWMSKTALGHRNGMRLRVFGDQGSAEWYQFEPEILHVTDEHGVRSQMDRGVEHEILATAHYNRFKAGHPSGYIEAFGNLYWDMANCLYDYRRTGKFDSPDVFGLRHATDGLCMLESAVESNRRRCWVDVKPKKSREKASDLSTHASAMNKGSHLFGMSSKPDGLPTDRVA